MCMKMHCLIYLAGTTIPCDWEMKRAVERGVLIKSPPNCLHYPGIKFDIILKVLQQCPSQIEQNIPQSDHTTTGTLRCDFFDSMASFSALKILRVFLVFALECDSLRMCMLPVQTVKAIAITQTGGGGGQHSGLHVN